MTNDHPYGGRRLRRSALLPKLGNNAPCVTFDAESRTIEIILPEDLSVSILASDSGLMLEPSSAGDGAIVDVKPRRASPRPKLEDYKFIRRLR